MTNAGQKIFFSWPGELVGLWQGELGADVTCDPQKSLPFNYIFKGDPPHEKKKTRLGALCCAPLDDGGETAPARPTGAGGMIPR